MKERKNNEKQWDAETVTGEHLMSFGSDRLDDYIFHDDRGYGVVEITYRQGEVNASKVRLTLVHDIDRALLDRKGLTFVRRLRIYRMTREAAKQGHLFSVDDLCGLLLSSLATLKRDIAYLREKGYEIALRRKKRRKHVA